MIEAGRPLRVGGVFVATTRGSSGMGSAGETGWAAAVVVEHGSVIDSVVIQGALAAPYAPGLLAMREGELLHAAVEGLRHPPDVLIVNASGRDHPRRAGLALHLGAACGLPSLGVTDRPLLATAAEPGPERGAASELVLAGEVVGFRLRTRAQARTIIVHAGWRVDAEPAREAVLSVTGRGRTPEPLREARRLARTSRASARVSF